MVLVRLFEDFGSYPIGSRDHGKVLTKEAPGENLYPKSFLQHSMKPEFRAIVEELLEKALWKQEQRIWHRNGEGEKIREIREGRHQSPVITDQTWREGRARSLGHLILLWHIKFLYVLRISLEEIIKWGSLQTSTSQNVKLSNYRSQILDHLPKIYFLLWLHSTVSQTGAKCQRKTNY